MLHLKRVTSQYELIMCQVSKELITFGEYYYEDDEDGLIVKATVYHEAEKKKAKDAFDKTKLENAKSFNDYKKALKKAEEELIKQTLADRVVFGRDMR